MNIKESRHIVLFSDPNFLALNILKDLLNCDFVVNIISDQRYKWIEKAKNFVNRTNILITSPGNYGKVSNFSHAVFCGGFIKKSSTVKDFKKFVSNKNFGNSKVLAIFPVELYSSINIKPATMNKNAGIVYLGDLFGPEIDLKSDLLLPTLIRTMIDKRQLILGVGELFSPILVSDVSKTIVQNINLPIFYGTKTFLMGKNVTSTDFWKQNIKYFPGLKIAYDTKISTRLFPGENQVKRINSDLGLFLNITYRWIIRDSIPVHRNKTEKAKKQVKKINIRISPFTTSLLVMAGKVKDFIKRTKSLIIIILIFLIFPIMGILASCSLLFFSYRNFINNESKIQGSQSIALIAKTLFVMNKQESNLLSNIPVVGKIYKESEYLSYLGENISDIWINSLPVMNTSEKIIEGILENQQYDVKDVSLQLKYGLDYFYQKVSLIQLETNEAVKNGVLSAGQVVNIINFDKYRNLAQQGSILVNNLPIILGDKEKSSYLMLFQNNMELRPTGGFIGSYGIADFDAGKLNALTVNDIYSADGQLKGHIDPPEPIKKYLGEANWFFRDSNWNPDFAVSSQRAEWFLNKEMGQQVNGTISVDLNPIKKILEYTGPIFLPDYNLTITSDNLYEKTQTESQANFFAGSRKKASFLTALSRVLIGKISQVNSMQKIGILKSIYEGMESRSIQIHFNNEDLQNPIDKLGWNGGLTIYSCGEKCYSDFFSEVEANVGVNKSNYFISRSFNYTVDFDNNRINRTLNVGLSNSANLALSQSGYYKTYLRVFIPKDAALLGAEILNNNSRNNLQYDINQNGDKQEVGFYVEVLPGEQKTISLRWSTNVSALKMDSYGLFIRKQAGTGSDKVVVRLNSKLPITSSNPVFTLTKPGTYTYNTDLSKDFFSKASFKTINNEQKDTQSRGESN